MRSGIMTFNPVKDCWMVETNGDIYDLRCGESFALIIGSECISCRLELAADWYVIMDNASLGLRPYETYNVII